LWNIYGQFCENNYLGHVPGLGVGPVSVTGLRAVGGVVGVDQGNLLSALNGCFWSYATMVLREAELRSLEAQCLSAGIRPANRPGASKAIGPDAFFELLQVSLRERDAHFLRHAGYHCGANLSRLFVGAVRHPNEGAERLLSHLGEAFPRMSVTTEARSDTEFRFSLQTGRGISAEFHEFAWGFLRGAATVLNEGAMPFIAERFEGGRKTWQVSVDWEKPALPATSSVTGGRKTPRRR
jgi:hypothetical protein